MISQIKVIQHHVSEAKKYSDFGEFRENNPDIPQHLYSKLRDSKEGKIYITKVSNNPGYINNNDEIIGYTPCFSEGLAIWIDCDNPKTLDCYHTSTIEKIDWEKGEFYTLNSIYKFEFDECEIRN